MSEYWISKKKYFCKYCDIYIADDAPSRQQHENGMRHKGNVERFIRGIYKAGEKQKDLEAWNRYVRLNGSTAHWFRSTTFATGLIASTSEAPSKPR